LLQSWYEGDNPVDAQQNRQLNDFAQDVVLFGLELLQQYFERKGDPVQLVIGQPTGNVVLDQLLAELPRSTQPRWVIASLQMQCSTQSNLGSRTFFDRDKYKLYLVVEVEADTDGSFRAVPTVFCTYRTRSRFQRFTEDDNHEAVAIRQPVPLLKHLLSCIEAFEAKIAARYASVTEVPKPTVETAVAIAPAPAPAPVLIYSSEKKENRENVMV
jgi:hypothetical protein